MLPLPVLTTALSVAARNVANRCRKRLSRPPGVDRSGPPGNAADTGSRATLATFLVAVLLVGSSVALHGCGVGGDSPLRFEISYPESVHEGPLDGRVFLIVTRRNDPEPRFQAAAWRDSVPFFAVDVEGLEPGEPAVIDDDVLGFPLDSVADLPEDDYYVQAAFHLYTTFERADGHVIQAPMDHWEGQQWNRSPGNLYSEVQPVHVDPRAGGTARIELTETIPPLELPEDTEYLKHRKFRSEILSEFWGTDIHLGAVVLLPDGWAEHPEARYPVAYYQGHFHREFYTPVGFREEPPGPDLEGYDRTYAEYSHRLYRDWTSGKLPRMIVVTMQHPTPYFDDSYAVDSENNGPYGEALTRELIPRIEEELRGIGEGWARTLYGGSTGGWEALAWQIFYPEMFNGAWAACPDPVDFRYYQLVNIYEDDNAFWPNSEWNREPIRPFMRDVDDEVWMTVQQGSQMELVLGTKGRSGQQLHAWEAAYGPVGEDGYPKPLWDKRTGVIDREVAEFMRENYDLRHILERDWATLGPKLVDKLHIYVGTSDNFYLEEAVRLMEQFLESTTDPHYAGEVKYGPRHPHCYSGPPDDESVRITRLTYNQRYLPVMADHITRTAPPGADTESWKY